MVEVEPGFGVVELVVTDDTNVWIDGGPRGVVQGEGRFTVPVGEHTIELDSAGFLDRRDIRVTEGTAVSIDLRTGEQG
jgi:hypothetical protein